MNLVLILYIFSLSAESLAAVVNFDLCEDVEDQYCQVKEVRVDPCKDAPNKPCLLRKGTNVSIDFDYIPLFSTNEAFSLAYSETFIADLPMPGMNKNACNFTQCPIIYGQKGTYSNKLYMSKGFPSSTYTVKWWLWDALHKDAHNQYIGCCFTIKIKLKG